jgi:hypothetical protein
LPARGNIDSTINRARHSGHLHAHTAHCRAQINEYVRIKPTTVLNHCGSGKREPLQDSMIMRCEHRRPTATSSGNSRSIAFCATERRSHEYDSNRTSKGHHADDLVMLLTTT